ncbi:MAG TPA: hypothetical protein VHT96_10400, partial [Clostridia bacterium]|nr:hypothetical protein [Clostridia bacterium]
IQSNITLENVMKEMANTAINANYIDYNPYFKLTIDWVKNAVLINTNSKIKLFDEFLYGLYIKKVITIPQNEYNSKELIENIILELHNIEQSGIDTDCFIINFSEDFEVPYDYRTQLIQCFSNLNKSTALLYKPEKFLNRTCISQEGITSVWDPTIYSAILSRQESKENILKIPVVAFFGTSYIEYSFIINNLNSLFRNDGYFSVGISNVCTDILYGMEYLPEWANIPNCLGSIYDKYECDVLLVGICHDMYEKNDIYNKNSINADIIITIEEVDGEGGIQIIAGDYNTIHIVFRYNIETISADISLLYKELINCFNSA